MGSPTAMIAVFAIYLWFVLKFGPDFMKKREAFKLVGIIRIYDIFQVAACAFFVAKVHQHGFTFAKTWECVASPNVENLNYDAKALLELWWYFVLLRAIELIETVFFVLRKKQNQVSALHIYHHISTVACLWTLLKFSGGKMVNFKARECLINLVCFQE